MRISDINELNMDFTLSYFMQITSRDDRIRFRSENYENISDIILYLEQIHAIWRPDIIPHCVLCQGYRHLDAGLSIQHLCHFGCGRNRYKIFL